LPDRASGIGRALPPAGEAKTGAAGVHIFLSIAALAIAKTPKGAQCGVGGAIKMRLFLKV
jgi:hypothetical protein